MTGDALFVGLFPSEADWGWRRILAQEGIPFQESRAPVSPVTVFAGGLPDWFETYVSEGGAAVVSSAPEVDGVLPRSQQALVHRFLPPASEVYCEAPGIVRLFEGAGEGQIRLHEDRKVKGENDPDRFAAVLSRRIGAGTVIYTGIPMTELLAVGGDRLRRFSPFTDVTERVSSVDKADVADALVWMLRAAFRSAGIPYVRLARFPAAAPSVFMFRVDVDGVYGDRARRLAEVASAGGIRASFFFNGSLCEEHGGDLEDWWRRHEVGQHGYLHNVFESVEANQRNLERGAAWVQRLVGDQPVGFVAPRGLWNRALEEALLSQGCTYSADFGLEFDSLPFQTPGGIWQIPMHPYSPERAGVFAEDSGLPPPSADVVRRHYLNVMGEQVRQGRPVHVYGHPEILGGMAEEVVPALAEAAKTYQLPVMTLGQFAGWWMDRASAGMSLAFDPVRREVGIGFGGDPWPVEVHTQVPVSVWVAGVGSEVPGGIAPVVVGRKEARDEERQEEPG